MFKRDCPLQSERLQRPTKKKENKVLPVVLVMKNQFVNEA